MSVWCLIIEDDRTVVGTCFKVPCPPGSDIEDLINHVVESELAGVDATFVSAYHSTAITLALRPAQLQSAVSELDLDKASVSPAAIVTEVVSGREVLIFKESAPLNLKAGAFFKRLRSPSPEIDHFACFKRARIVQETPSQVAQFAQYEAIQADSSERLLDDRPESDQTVAPISLLYAPFGEFDDIFSGRVPPADIKINFAQLQNHVNELATAMSRCYDTDDQRRHDGVYLFWRMSFRFPLWAGSTEAHGLVTTIATFKNQHPSVPYLENVARIARSHTSSHKFKDICRRWRVPALTIAIDGSTIHFYAILLLGHQYRVVSLTPGLSWSLYATNGRDREHLYSAFAAADGYVLDIPREFLPAVSKIRERGHDGDDSKYLEFDIIDYFGPWEHYRHLYCAKVRNGAATDQDKFIIVKFSKRYSIDLHGFCAERGHAPKVFGYERLPGGWFVIAMEWLMDAESMQAQHYLSQREELLVELVNGFHEKDLVHGDLRYVNILCEAPSDKVWLVDFDWGGKAGEVAYPTWLLDGELVRGRESSDLIIRKEDDLRILRATLQALQSEE
ncbi:hypothetical protein D9619_006107 [Psilocybe cf. subviscida]|uniref:Uncharacterized protein n=1 Tax=Psilocybe cf. subviscida TaxID=2480587 RepID=A0A8H5B4K4_9AGAR|nr:hypothetical protein D9619_006107 [Psilocybe cf. subviscida]